MIIDIHTHVADFRLYPDNILNGIVNDGTIDRKKLKILLKLLLKDPDCRNLIKQMDDAGIEKSVLQIIDFSDQYGKTALTIGEIYDLHYKILEKHKDRFMVFGGFHPDRGASGVEIFKKGIEKYGFSGLKLYPPLGYPVNDPRLSACYEICSYYNLPVLIHTGFSTPEMNNQYGEPDSVKEMAMKYRSCNFILAHAGYKLKNPVISTLLETDNIYADISGFQSARNQGDSGLNLIFEEKYNNKILFGSDWPIANLMKPVQNQINLIRNISEQADRKVKGALNNIFELNAKRILKL